MPSLPNFLEGVRLIQAPSPGVTMIKSDDDESGEKSIQIEPGGKITVHKHSSGDNDFLAVPIVAIVFTFIWLITKAIMAPFHNKNRVAGQTASGGGLTEEEVAILHKLERTLSQMEGRVEALETILIDQNRTAKNYGSKF